MVSWGILRGALQAALQHRQELLQTRLPARARDQAQTLTHPLLLSRLPVGHPA